MAGVWNGKQLRLKEVHRFANGAVSSRTRCRWDVVGSGPKSRRPRAAGRIRNTIVSVGADTWGVGLRADDQGGRSAGLPYHYRDVCERRARWMRVTATKFQSKQGVSFVRSRVVPLNSSEYVTRQCLPLAAVRRRRRKQLGGATDGHRGKRLLPSVILRSWARPERSPGRAHCNNSQRRLPMIVCLQSMDPPAPTPPTHAR